MIEAITIQGFQSHVESRLKLGTGLNVITGPSDSGKTSIIRAVKWLAFNEPTGEAFVNALVGEATVTIYLSSGQIITKKRRKGKTSYLLQLSEDDEGSLYEKSEVPEEVKQLLQIEKQTFGDFETALNFSFQLDAPFLISETASAGAKILGKLAGTESVDLAIKGVSKDTYGTRQDRTNAEKEIERIAGAMLAYAGIDDAKEAIDVAEMLLEQIDANHTHLEGLKENRNTYESLLNKLEQIGVKLDLLAIVPQLEEDLQNIEKAQQRYDMLLDLYNSYGAIWQRINAADLELDRYTDIEEAAASVEDLSKQVERLTLLSTLTKEYQKYTDQHIKTVAVLEKTVDLPYTVELLNVLEKYDLQQLNDLKMMNLEYKNVARRAEIAQERLKAFDGLIEAEAALSSTGEDMDRLALLKQLRYEYFDGVGIKYTIAKGRIEATEKELQEAKNEESAAWEASGGICPLCEQLHERGAC